MTNFDITKPSGRTTVLMTAILGCAIVVALLTMVWSYHCLSRSRVTTVNFEDLSNDEDRNSYVPDDHRPVLRVAVAAMISPMITKKYYEDLLRAVGDAVGRRVVFLQRKTYSEVNDLLDRKEIDVAFVCSGPYVAGHKKFGMEIVAVPVVHGEKVYHSYILAQRNSPVTSLDDLKGQRFAFTDPKSNTGYLVPQYMLFQRGYNPETFFSETSYTYSHDNSIKAVAEGVADGAAVDNLIWEFIDATDPTYTSRTKIVEKSPPYGIPPVVVHPDLDPDLKERLRAVFLSLHQNPEVADILKRLQIQRFEDGDDAMYETVRDMEAWIENYEKAKSEPPVK